MNCLKPDVPTRTVLVYFSFSDAEAGNSVPGECCLMQLLAVVSVVVIKFTCFNLFIVKKKKMVFFFFYRFLSFTVSGLPKRTGQGEWGNALGNPEQLYPLFGPKIATKSTEARVKGRKIQKLWKSLLSPLVLNKYYVGFMLCYVTVFFRVTSLDSPRGIEPDSKFCGWHRRKSIDDRGSSRSAVYRKTTFVFRQLSGGPFDPIAQFVSVV